MIAVIEDVNTGLFEIYLNNKLITLTTYLSATLFLELKIKLTSKLRKINE